MDPKIPIFKDGCWLRYVLTALAHCFVLLGLTKRPAGVREQWRICLLPTACLDSVVSLATPTWAPSLPNRGRPWPGGGRRPATVPSVTSLPSQTAVLARALVGGENQQRQDEGQDNPTTCADIKRYRIFTFRLFCCSAFWIFFFSFLQIHEKISFRKALCLGAV